MRYIKDGAVAADPWVYIEGDEPVPPDVPAIVSPDWLFAAEPSAIASRSAPLGVAWPNDRPESELAPHLAQLSLIALEFPVFRDGRAYTQARTAPRTAWLQGRDPGDRRRAPRSVPVHGAGRLQRVRSEKSRRCGGLRQGSWRVHLALSAGGQ